MRAFRLISMCLLTNVTLSLPAMLAQADEGMWPLNRFPTKTFQDRHAFAPTAAWLDHVRLASVRFNSGGSGSFVARTGLVMTNHHVGTDCIQKLSQAGKDLIGNGFLANTSTEELRCPDLELNVLQEMRDVTAEIQAAIPKGLSPAATNAAQKAALSQVEKACTEKTHDRCDVVTLYDGGLFDLYRYRKFTDVRLVFAPEGQIAFFGGDIDNFTFPRFDYDMALFRVYDQGKPWVTDHFLTWNPEGGRDGDLVVTSGHPGSTARLMTVAEMKTLRDVVYPGRIAELDRIHAALVDYAQRSPEADRQQKAIRHGVDNARKALGGYLKALTDDAQLQQRAQKELSSDKNADFKSNREAIDKTQPTLRHLWPRLRLLEQTTMNSKLLGIARHLLRMRAELSRPEGERLREYRSSNLASVELALYSPAPVYLELEEALLTEALQRLALTLGAEDPLTVQVLAGLTPQARAKALVKGCTLADVSERKRLAADGKALDSSADSLLALARILDGPARAARKQLEDEVEGPVKAGHSALARAAFAAQGQAEAPDATFTLRLSVGKVAGYTEENGAKMAAWTTYGGLFARSDKAHNELPWQLPPRWLKARDLLDMSVPFNAASTNDIIGGNSGSPIVDRDGKLVGLIFDGNIQSLSGQFWYDGSRNRAIWVHAKGLIQALRKVYGAEALAKELLGN